MLKLKIFANYFDFNCSVASLENISGVMQNQISTSVKKTFTNNLVVLICFLFYIKRLKCGTLEDFFPC